MPPDFLRKAVRILRTQGPAALAKRGLLSLHYRKFRPHLPRRQVVFNGTKVKALRLFDLSLLSKEGDRPEYESGIIDSLKHWTREGDTVVIVGGGWGVTAVNAAKQVGEEGEVHVFEGSKEEVEYVKETARINDVETRVTVHHAVVGTAISLRGKSTGAQRINPEELPECDVLELDCEGAEKGILEKLDIEPRVAIVESHGEYDSPSENVERQLETRGYNLVSKQVADRSQTGVCLEKDIFVITGISKE